MLDFPNAPLVGQVFSDGDASWVWDGVKWVVGEVGDIGPPIGSIVADGVWHPLTGATVALGSNTVTVSTASFTSDDSGKRFTMIRGGSPVSFASGRITAPGTGYRAADTISVAGAAANVWSVTAVAAAIVSGGTGGPPSASFIVKGIFPGRRGRRDAARITVLTNAGGVVTSIVRIEKGGTYTNASFDGVAAGFDSTDYPGLTGLTIGLTLGAFEIRRNAACFYGRISGTTLTVEEMIYGTIATGHSFSGIEVIEGTTIVGPISGTGGLGTYTLSNAHSDMADNVFLFVSETLTTTTSPPAASVSPTGGSGSGLAITPSWRGLPLVGNIVAVLGPTQIQLDVTAASAASNVGYCYGNDYGPEIQGALDAGQEVLLPAGVICHSTPLVFKNRSRLLGLGSSLGNDANTILAYVGPRASRGAQLGANDAAGNIDGCVIGEFMLMGNNLIGIGFYMRGGGGSQIRPMSIRAHTYIGVQLSGGNTGPQVGNIHSHLVVREIDSPGWDTTGIYLGPGYQPDPLKVAVNDVCRTKFPYWQVDVDMVGFGRPVWYRVADSNSHGFVKARGPADLPGFEFASHDTKTTFARAISFDYIDASSMWLRGGAYPSDVGVSYLNYLNGGSGALVDGTPEATEAIEDDDPQVTTEFGARFFSISNGGTMISPRLQPYHFVNRQQPKNNSWVLTPVIDANTNIPGAEITGTGVYSVLAYTDGLEVLRVLSSSSAGTVGIPTVLSTGNFTASVAGGLNVIRALIPSGNLLYVVSSAAAVGHYLHVIDVSDPALPIELSETVIGASGNACSAQLAGAYLFITVLDAVNSVRVVDVSDPWAPALVATIATGNGGANGLAIAGNVLFVGCNAGGVFRTYGLAALPGVPPQLGTLTLAGVTSITQISIRGKYAYLAQDNATDTNLGLQIIDISNPAAPVLAGSYDASQGAAGDYDCRGLAVSGAYAFTVVTAAAGIALHVVNISNPASPSRATTLPLSVGPQILGSPLLLLGDSLYLTQTFGGIDLARYNVANPLLPTVVAGAGVTLGADGGVIAASGNLLFVSTTAATDNLKILQIVGSAQESAAIGSLRTDRARLEHLDVDRDARINGGLSVGNQGLYSKGVVAGSATQTRVYTVATLPAGRLGLRALVADATAPAFLAAPVGGGGVRAPVFWDDGGGAWKVG